MLLFNLHTHNKPSCCAQDDNDIYGIYNDNIYSPELSSPFSIGIHPCFLTEENLDSQIQTIISNSENHFFKALGESGLDRLCNTPYDLQKRAFIQMVALSERLGKPLIIHCVKAIDDIIAIKKSLKPKQQWIFHGFRGKPQQAQSLLGNNICLSLGRNFNADSARIIPLDKLFIETDEDDCYLIDLYNDIARVKGMTTSCLADTVSIHSKELFGFEKDCIKK